MTANFGSGWARVILESPFAGDRARNVAYAQEMLRRCLLRRLAPIASHLLYTQCLDDNVPEQRELGIQAGFVWRPHADYTIFCCRYGWSSGMRLALEDCRKRSLPFIAWDADRSDV